MAVTQQTGTHVHAQNLNEQLVVEIDPGGTPVIFHNVEIDCTELLEVTVFRFYRQIGGVFRQRAGQNTADGGEQTYTPGLSAPLLFFWHDSVCENDKTKITAQTTVQAENADRDVPWQFGYEA